MSHSSHLTLHFMMLYQTIYNVTYLLYLIYGEGALHLSRVYGCAEQKREDQESKKSITTSTQTQCIRIKFRDGPNNSSLYFCKPASGV